jgi:NACalpha-BTF3-like transcription factor
MMDTFEWAPIGTTGEVTYTTPKIDSRSIMIVMEVTKSTYDRAKKALTVCDGNISNAITYLMQRDIDIVVRETNKTDEEAKIALIRANGDIISAIMSLRD